MTRRIKIAVDFDGTIVDHRFPLIGSLTPDVIQWLNAFRHAGALLILFTMRSGQPLDEAVDFCARNGVEFYGVNRDPDQDEWSQSPKAYAHIYIDDAGIGCPLHENPRVGGRPFVDWEKVGPKVMARIAQLTATA